MSKINQVKDPILEKLGNKIIELRKAKGINRDVFAREAGLSKYYFYRVEYGNANPSILQIKKIADALGVETKSLIDF